MPRSAVRDGSEGQVSGLGLVLNTPLFKQPAVAQRNVIFTPDADPRGRTVDPFGRSFQFGVVADWRFIYNAMAFAIVPFGAPLFVLKGGHQAQRFKYFFEGSPIGHVRFCFNAVLVRVNAGPIVGQSLVRYRPAPAVTANPQYFSAGTHAAVWRVVKYVALECARSVQCKSGSRKPLRETGQVSDFEFDFGLDSHRKERVYGRALRAG